MMRAEEIRWASRQTTETASQPQVALAVTLRRIKVFIRRYVVLSKNQVVALTLWVAHSYAIAAADYTPYLHVTSATAESGKTRLLEVLKLLAYRPWYTGRVSAAVLVRKIDAEHPTLLLDESDAAFNGEKEYAEALRGILNTGFQRNGTASLCVVQSKAITYKDFSTFSPKAIAGIGKLPGTVTSRAIRIELRRRTKEEPVRKFRERDAGVVAEPMRQALVTWAARTDVITALREARPRMPAGLRDRAEDVVEPLLAIANLAGGDWPRAARKAVVALMGSIVEPDVNVELLHDIYDVFKETGLNFMASDELAKRLAALDSRPWGDWKNGKPITTRALADRLKAFGITPTQNSSRTVRGYYKERFLDAWARYPAPKASESSGRQ
jgi:hypothetical protein